MLFKTILCATDFTPSSRHALTVAMELARDGGRLDICNVVERERLAAEIGDIPGAARLFGELSAQGERALEEWRRTAATIVPAANAHSFGGRRPWDVIADAAKRFKSDLVVVGSGGEHHGLLGSTAERIMRHAPCSSLVVAGGARTPRRLLCAIDFSPASREAMRVAGDLAVERGAIVCLVHAFTLAEVDFPWLAMYPPMVGDARGRAKETLHGWASELEARTRRAVASEIVDGRPADAILRLAADGDYDWLVTGSHGRTGIARAFLGSVAEHIVRRADRPVLIVRSS